MTTQDRVFALQSHLPDFHTGTCANGTQVLMGLLCPDIISVFFNADGEILGAERQVWKIPAPISEEDGDYLTDDPDFQHALKLQIQQWQHEIGYTPTVIRVQEFGMESDVGITELPDELYDASPDDEHKQEFIQDWQAQGKCVLYWGALYEISSDGLVLPSTLEEFEQEDTLDARQEIEAMFERIADQTTWDMSHDMLWGYFFTNDNEVALHTAASELVNMGYSKVDIFQADQEDGGEPNTWVLHVERVETHNVDSLAKRGIEFDEFAARHGLTSYDGMDVGPTGPTLH